eukprot:symbB.v1.2.028313.t2/scaffold2956.1/size66508/2
MKWHPDKNQDNQEKAQKKFIEISHAYEVLGDPEKKAKYDRHGEAGLNEGQGGGGHGNAGFQGQDPFEMFRSFFGGGGGPPSCFQHPSIPKFYAIGVMERVKVLPCWESQEVAVRPLKELVSELQLGEGRTNQNFIVDCAASRYFVRLGADLPFYGVSRVREQAAARAAEAAGIAPAVRYTEADVMVVDFVEKSRALTEADLHAAGQEGVKSELLRSVGRSLRQLHATPVPEELEAFLREIGTIGWGGPHLEKWLRYAEEEKYSRLPLLDGLRSLIDQLNRAAGPLGPNKFCHFDLLADNLVLKEDGSILLVDFEYSAPGQPLMDLAVLAMGCSLSSVEEQSLLSAYLDREATEAEGLQFQALRVLAALRETFWGVTAELSQSSALSMEEAVCYTDMNFQKFVELREAKLSTFYGKSGVFKRHVIWSRTQFSFQQGSGIIVWEFAPCPMATSSSNFSCAAGCSRYAWPRKGFRKEPKSSVILEGRIFVSIVAYCDPELPSTILSLLSQSERPDLLYIGLIWQGPETELLLPTTELQKFWTHESHETRLPTVTSLVLPTGTLDISTTHGGHLRVISMPAEDARGPCWARYLAQLLWKKEELYLQLDSHMRFVPLWDRKARRDLLICQQKSQKPVLCCYGRAYQQGLPYDMAPKNLTGCLNCAAFFDAHNILNIRYRSLRHDWDEPRKSYFWSAHFSFSSSECLKEVPYDPRLLMLFFGEEILMTVRFWTHGWDLFSPAQGLIFHLWERDYRRVYAEDMKELYQDLCRSSRRRLHGMLGSGPGAFFYEQPLPWPLPGGCHASGGDPFGLGLERTVADYERCAGVSFSDRRLDAFALRGGADSESAFITQETGEQAVIELQCQSDMQKLQRERGGGGHFQFGGGGGFPGGPSQGGGRSSKGNKLLFQEVPGVQELTSKTWKVFLHLQSVRPRRVLVEEPLVGQLVETGCKFLGTEVLYQCSLNEVTDAPQAIPQLFSLRVDCRGADGDFRNLTLFDNQQVCGRMGYKKYGRNSGHIRSPSMRLPFLSDRIITLEKEDVIDIQCVLLPFSEDDFFKETWWKEGSVKFEGGGYRELKTIMPFRLILDGDIENTPGKVGAFDFLTASAAGPDACQDAIFRAYKWTVTLHETQKNTHWIRISSPKLGLPKLPKVDLPEFQEGEVFAVTKESMRMELVEATCNSTANVGSSVVVLDSQFYDSKMALDYYSINLKLQVHAEQLPRNTASVQVKLRMYLRHDVQDFTLEIPVEDAGEEINQTPSTVLVVLGCALLVAVIGYLCYLHRRKAEMEEESLRRNRLVLFYESNLPEMQELKDAMTEVGAKLVEGSSLVLAGAVNCGRSETLCQKQGIKKLPEVVYFGPEGEQPNRLITVSVGANLGLLHFFDEVVLNCVLMHMNQPWGPRVGVIFRVLLSLPSLTKAFWFEFENLTLISGWHTVPPYKTSSRTMCDVVDLLEDLLDGPWTVLVQDSPPPRSKTPEPLPPSDDELRQAIKKLLMGKDLSTISLKALRLDLERGFKLPAGGLDSRKGEIRTLAQDLVVEAQNAPPPAPSTPVPVEPAAKKRRTLTQAVPVAPEGALSAPASPVKTKGPRKKARNHDRTTGQREDQCFGSTPPPRDPVANDTS